MSGQNETKTSPERRVLGELGNNPDSPTANLRLLTNLASNLKSVANSPCQGCSGTSREVQSTPVQESGCIKLLPRKEKSLSLLCNKFLHLFPLDVQDNALKEISLNTTAQSLGTEKRRIYDIINVLESLEMASKAGKNVYYWHGQSRLPMTLAKLKMTAIELGLDKQIQEIQKINRAFIEDSCHTCRNSKPSLMVPQSPVVDYCFPDASVKEDKSLGVMCRKFVMLFLVSLKHGVINLDIAAKVLINEPDIPLDTESSSTAQSRFKTKVRRLYDIANVLSAIGLIEKVDFYSCVIRKPIFRYTGPSVDCLNLDAETPSTENETQSLVGMTTPNKKDPNSISLRTLNRMSRFFTSTPAANKKETRKRKLFDTDNKLPRTQSSPCLRTKRNRSSEHLDDSLLDVVKMELERLNSSEHKPKVCTQLFTRHSSDSCIPSSKKNVSSSSIETEADSGIDQTPSTSEELNSSVDSCTVLPVVSKENLVSQSRNIVTPIRTVRINGPLELKIAPAFTMQQPSTPKYVKLSSFDIKKLVPVSKEDIKIKLATVKPVVQATSSSQKPNIAILTQLSNKKISPGDTFKAIKVGNTVKLIPIESKSDSSKKK